VDIHLLTKRTFRAAAWLLLLAIVVLSVVPPEDRPVTPAPHDLEHLGIFLLTGFAFGIGYSAYLLELCGLIVFSAAIELVQLTIPGRHARLGDFVVDSMSVCIGVGIGYIGARWLDAHLRRRDA
jgi:VanZ family protein